MTITNFSDSLIDDVVAVCLVPATMSFLLVGSGHLDITCALWGWNHVDGNKSEFEHDKR